MVYYNVFLRRRQRNRKRSLWVHTILTLHRQQGEYYNFLWEMHLSNTEYYFRYLRMSKVQLSTSRCRHVWFWQSDWLDTTYKQCTNRTLVYLCVVMCYVKCYMFIYWCRRLCAILWTRHNTNYNNWPLYNSLS